MKNPRFNLSLIACGVLVTVVLVIVFTSGILLSPPDHHRFISVAENAKDIQDVIAEFGTASRETVDPENNRSLVYETTYDLGKFQESRFCVLTVDKEGQIIEIAVELKHPNH